ncbi:MAG: aldose 1-epimerase family protein [Actinomycetaceae bacterium]|nr:aldose 1-epimerase family protein [Actinomycetaceae bacterium]
MRRSDLLSKVGNLQQVMYARPVRYQDGRADGMHAIEVKNDDLRFVAMADKALDIAELEYRGTALQFLSKPGLNGRNPFDTHGEEAVRSIMGGFFFTCGLENIGGPYTDAAGKEYPLHGRLRTSPAEHIQYDVAWQGDECVATVAGEVREAELFGENLVLRRRIETRLGTPSIAVTDEIRNEGFADEPMMIMYHCNIGWPLVDEGSEIILPSLMAEPRDEATERDATHWSTIQAPEPNRPESVFIHTLAGDADGSTFAALVNEKLGLALLIEFSTAEFPYFMEWKSMASGDYVIGLEPANSSVRGRGFHEQQGDLHHLAAQSSEVKRLTFTVVSGAKEIAELRERRDRLTKAAG